MRRESIGYGSGTAIGTHVVVCITMSLSMGQGCADPKAPLPRERSRLKTVHEGEGAIRIEGIGPIRGFGKGRDNTFMHCLELVLDGMGRKIGYDELMGVSGMAFRVQFRVDRWDVGNPDPLVGESCLDALFSAIGFDYTVRVVRREELQEAADLKQAIAGSLNRQSPIPVLAANIILPEDWGIITGYRQGHKWLCRSYHGGAQRTDREANAWPTAVVLMRRRLQRPPRRQTHVNSLRRAVDLFERRRSGSYALGAKAFDFWCQNLRAANDRSYIHANIWTYIGLMDARGAAVRYLKTIATEFGARSHLLLQAADYYDREVRLLQEGYRDIPYENQFPDSMPPPELRERQIQLLKNAKDLETKAIAALRKAI